MNKSLFATVIVAFLLVGITASWLVAPYDNQSRQILLIPDSFAPIDDSQYMKIGHEADALKGTAFSAAVENSSLKPENWSALPVHYADANSDADLVISLDQQLYEQFAEVIMQYAREQQLIIAINKGTCGVSSSVLNKKEVDIAGFCCPPGNGDRLPGLKYHTLGISSIALLVNEENPLQGVTTDQARNIFSGKLKKWNAITASPKLDNYNIDVVTRLHCKSRPGHWTLILSGQDHFSSTARETGDIPYMIAEINRNTYAIGYETLFMVQRENKPLKILEVDNIHPANQEALAKGFYPFYRTYSLTTWQQPENNLNAEKLIDYLSRYIDEHAQQLRIVPISELQKQGWLVSDGELIGEPGNAGLVSMEVE